MMDNWVESAKFKTSNERFAHQTKMILKKGWFSNLEILEICKQVSWEECVQEEPRRRELKHNIKI